MKTSLITTVLNEEENILSLLKSIESQSMLPGELIIVDGGSTDKTLDTIKNFQKKSKIKIKLISKKGNRSEGRNAAISNSAHEIILCTDSGCTLDKDWVKNISSPFNNPSIGVVGGFYIPVTQTDFEKCLSTYTCVMPDQVDKDNFLPSSRSVAFRKSSWEKVGGYPKWLDTCEDLYFAREMKSKNINFVFKKDAIVKWPQRKNIIEAFKQFFSYAKGDGSARYFRKNTPLLFGRYFLGILLIGVFVYTRSYELMFLIIISLICYMLWAIMKNYKYVKRKSAFIWLPILQFTADFAVLLGTTIGLIKSFTIEGKK